MKKLFLLPLLLLFSCAVMTGCESDNTAAIPETYDDSQVSDADLAPSGGAGAGAGDQGGAAPPPMPPQPK